MKALDNAIRIDPNDAVIIGLDTKDGPEHPLWDERINLELAENLLWSVKREGVMLPVRLIKVGDSYLVESGRQRVRAARKAGRKLIPALVVSSVPSADELQGDDLLRSAAENAARTQDNMLARARLSLRLSERGVKPAEQQRLFGLKSTAAISQWQTIAQAPEQLQTAVEHGVQFPDGTVLPVPGTVAYHLARSEEPLVALEWWADFETGKPNVNKAKKALKGAHLAEPEPEPEPSGEGGEEGPKSAETSEPQLPHLTAAKAKKLADELNALGSSSEGRKADREFALAMAIGIDVLTGFCPETDVPEVVQEILTEYGLYDLA